MALSGKLANGIYFRKEQEVFPVRNIFFPKGKRLIGKQAPSRGRDSALKEGSLKGQTEHPQRDTWVFISPPTPARGGRRKQKDTMECLIQVFALGFITWLHAAEKGVSCFMKAS